MLFIFRPLSIQIRKTITNLMQSQLESDTNTKEIQQLFEEKEKSLQELQELNFVIDNAFFSKNKIHSSFAVVGPA